MILPKCTHPPALRVEDESGMVFCSGCHMMVTKDKEWETVADFGEGVAVDKLLKEGELG